MATFKRSFTYTFWIVVGLLLLTRSTVLLSDPLEKIRSFTRAEEFDYTQWTVDAAFTKLDQIVVSLDAFIPSKSAVLIIKDYLDLIQRIQSAESRILEVYSDPDIGDPDEVTAASKQELAKLITMKENTNSFAESILQNQISLVLDEMGISPLDQPLPPLLYHSSPLPYALIVSPRDTIRQDANISLRADLSLDEILQLENRVSNALDVSTLIEEIGGIGTYPTMVMQSPDLPWIVEVIAHEWIHNMLTFQPLGLEYESSAQMRTINETTASLAGKEISLEVLRRFYPEYLPPPEMHVPQQSPQPEMPNSPPEFDFQKEMHITRVQADALLAEGKIEAAEKYMESRRIVFWDRGFQIRRLNQAYFAFHGAYADIPGGAAGEDPVGPAVRELRRRSPTLASFLWVISKVNTYTELMDLLGGNQSTRLID
jgi:hypothetical protein